VGSSSSSRSAPVTSERHAALLSARECRRLALPELRAEADAGEHDLDVALGVPVGSGLELVVQAVLLDEQALLFDALRGAETLVHEVEFAAHGAQLLEPALDEGAHAHPGGELGPLRHVAQARALAERDGAPIGLFEALDHAQERGLAAAVAADEPDLLARVDAQAGAAQDFVRAEVLLESIEMPQGEWRAEEDTRRGKALRTVIAGSSPLSQGWGDFESQMQTVRISSLKFLPGPPIPGA